MYSFSSQWPPGQDQFVSKVLKNKKDGFFVDIGAYDYCNISNTYFLEKELNWRGLAIELDSSKKENWDLHRKNSLFVCADALDMDYKTFLEQLSAPSIIDYLSVDIEPPYGTLCALKKILEANYTYRIITFEIDSYRGDLRPKEESREILSNLGYTRIESLDNEQDDFWVNYNYIDGKINAFYKDNVLNIEHL